MAFDGAKTENCVQAAAQWNQLKMINEQTTIKQDQVSNTIYVNQVTNISGTHPEEDTEFEKLSNQHFKNMETEENYINIFNFQRGIICSCLLGLQTDQPLKAQRGSITPLSNISNQTENQTKEPDD